MSSHNQRAAALRHAFAGHGYLVDKMPDKWIYDNAKNCNPEAGPPGGEL